LVARAHAVAICPDVLRDLAGGAAERSHAVELASAALADTGRAAGGRRLRRAPRIRGAVRQGRAGALAARHAAAVARQAAEVTAAEAVGAGAGGALAVAPARIAAGLLRDAGVAGVAVGAAADALGVVAAGVAAAAQPTQVRRAVHGARNRAGPRAGARAGALEDRRCRAAEAAAHHAGCDLGTSAADAEAGVAAGTVRSAAGVRLRRRLLRPDRRARPLSVDVAGLADAAAGRGAADAVDAVAAGALVRGAAGHPGRLLREAGAVRAGAVVAAHALRVGVGAGPQARGPARVAHEGRAGNRAHLAARPGAAAERLRLIDPGRAGDRRPARQRVRLLLAASGAVAGARVAARGGARATPVRLAGAEADHGAGAQPVEAARLTGRAARGVAADAVGAGAADALIGRGATDAGPLLRHAAPARAVVPGRAVAVAGAGRLALRGTAQIRAAILRAGLAAGARSRAEGRRLVGRGAARLRQTALGRRRILLASPRAVAEAGVAAHAVGRAVGRIGHAVGDVGAGAGAVDVARLAGGAAGGRAADAVGAVAAGALIRGGAAGPVRLLRDAAPRRRGAAGAIEAGARAVRVRGAVRPAARAAADVIAAARGDGLAARAAARAEGRRLVGRSGARLGQAAGDVRRALRAAARAVARAGVSARRAGGALPGGRGCARRQRGAASRRGAVAGLAGAARGAAAADAVHAVAADALVSGRADQAVRLERAVPVGRGALAGERRQAVGIHRAGVAAGVAAAHVRRAVLRARGQAAPRPVAVRDRGEGRTRARLRAA